MNKKTSFFDLFRGKSRNEQSKVDNKSTKTTQSNKEPESYAEYLSGCEYLNYTGFLLDSRYNRDKFPEDYEPQFSTIMHTCRQVFIISGFRYYIEQVPGAVGKFVCYLNFENSDIRVICEFIKTLLYSNTNYIDFNIYYSLVHDNPAEVKDDMDFLLNMPPYSLIFGYNKKIRAFFFRDCEMTTEPIESAGFTTALKEGKLDDAANILAERRELFARIIHTDLRYSYRAMYDFLIDSYLALRDFYTAKEAGMDLYDTGFEDLLATFDDAAGFIDKLTEDLENYAENSPAYKASDLEAELIRNVKEFVRNNVSTVTLQTAATNFGVSYAHLSRLFKKNVQMNFSEYVADVKLEAAGTLLKETDKNISEISIELGYNSPSYFLTRFKEHYGMTPSVYRKQYYINK